MNCSSVCTLTLPATPPSSKWNARMMSIGSTLATVSLNGLNYNGGATAPALIKYMPLYVTTDGSNYFGDVPLVAGSNITITPAANGATVAASGGGGSPCTTTANAIQYDNSGSFGCTDIQEISNVLSNLTTTQSETFQGGQNASANSALGAGTFQGADQTGAGGSSSAGGGALLRGGKNAATNAASTAGNVELQSGQSTGSSSTGLQGLMLIAHSYAISGTAPVQWGLACFTTTANAVTKCGATPQNIAGVAVALNGSVEVEVAQVGSEVPITATAAVTIGDAVYAGSTAGDITDCGATSGCANGVLIGHVIATTGTYQSYPDGTTFPTLSTTLPLVRVESTQSSPAYISSANGVNIAGASATVISIGTGNGSMSITNPGSASAFQLDVGAAWTAGASFYNAVVFELKSTNTVTAGEVLKLDTSNAESVVPVTTSDTTAALGFATGGVSAGGVVKIAMPGSLIYTPVMGTGTCTLGQYVIVDTTTAGDVKCTSTFTAGTILGRVIVAQSTVGNAVGVMVWPQ